MARECTGLTCLKVKLFLDIIRKVYMDETLRTVELTNEEIFGMSALRRLIEAVRGREGSYLEIEEAHGEDLGVLLGV
jgi:hypothetical protein